MKKEEYEALQDFIKAAYIKRKKVLATLFSDNFIEIGWIAIGMLAYGIQKKIGHDGNYLYAIYVAKEGRTKGGNPTVIPDIEANKLFRNEDMLKKYIRYLKDLHNAK